MTTRDREQPKTDNKAQSRRQAKRREGRTTEKNTSMQRQKPLGPPSQQGECVEFHPNSTRSRVGFTTQIAPKSQASFVTKIDKLSMQRERLRKWDPEARMNPFAQIKTITRTLN